MSEHKVSLTRRKQLAGSLAILSVHTRSACFHVSNAAPIAEAGVDHSVGSAAEYSIFKSSSTIMVKC
jgi:hypothetical protein